MEAKLKNKSEIKEEARATFSQRMSNTHTRILAGSSLDEAHISQKLKDQLRRACGCGKKLYINKNNRIEKFFTCKKRFCLSCVKGNAWKRDMALFPSVKKIIEMKVRDPKHNAGLWFVTLTLPTCEASELPERLALLQKSWRNMYIQMKKTRNKAYVNGIRKLEINPTPKSWVTPKAHTDYKYNAHLHVLIQGKGNADELQRRWLQMHPDANKGAQDIRKFDDKKGSLVEMLKYLTKPLIGEDKRKGIKKESSYRSDARRKAMAFIYDSLIGRRIIFTYGKVRRAAKFELFFNEEGKLMFTQGKEYVDVFNDCDERQKRRILNHLDGQKAKASRPLAETLWHFVNGHYVNDETGEKLCSEKDVAEAAAAKGKRALHNYVYEKQMRRMRVLKGGEESLDKQLARMEKKEEQRKKKHQTYIQEVGQTIPPNRYCHPPPPFEAIDPSTLTAGQLHFKNPYYRSLYDKRQRLNE